MNQVISKILRTFFTSLVLFYSRKLVYYIDIFFTDVFSEDKYVECNQCHYQFRVDIVEKHYDNCCPKCSCTSYKNIVRDEVNIRDKILKGIRPNDRANAANTKFQYKYDRRTDTVRTDSTAV